MADAMASGVPVFGVCLGAQLMSRVLGGEVGAVGRVRVRSSQDLDHGSRKPRPGVRQAARSLGADAPRRVLHGT